MYRGQSRVEDSCVERGWSCVERGRSCVERGWSCVERMVMHKEDGYA